MKSFFLRGRVIGLAFAVFLFPAAASAADPGSGTLSASQRTLTYTSGPFLVSNPTSDENGGVCETESSCDHYELTVDLRGVDPATPITITTSWSNGDEDFDVYLLDAEDNAPVNRSAGSANPEIMYMTAGELAKTAYRIRIIPFLVMGGTTTTVIQLGSTVAGDPCAITGTANAGAAVLAPGVARALVSLPPETPYGAFVHFSKGTPAEHRALLQARGLRVIADFERYAAAVFATGPLGGFRSLVAEPSVSYLEEHKSLRYFGETGAWATRVRVAQEAVSGGPYRDERGEVLRGQGVTVAIIDTGLNATHPDFAGRVKHNWKISGDPFFTGAVVFEDAGYGDTDTTSGHGTHVAGTAVGSGAASTGDYPIPELAPLVRGTFAGAAPDAQLVSYSVGETPDPTGLAGVALLLYIDSALQHLLDHYDSITPRVRVVSLSLGDGAGSQYNPADVTACLVKGLVAKGTNVVWAAGNGDDSGDGGNGTEDRTSSYCKDPTPGVLCVANYDDGASGSVAGYLASSSSRGKLNEFETYPDIAAPGTNITAPCLQGAPGQVTCSFGAETRWAPFYGTITGTSMATPHVSGAIALLTQARPDLSPAQVEDVIQDSARKVATNGAYQADPQNPGSTTNFGFGAGLLNLQAALDRLNVAHGASADATVAVIGRTPDSRLPGAADVLQVTAQAVDGGVRYAVTLRDGGDFGSMSGLVYTVEHNANGNHYESAVRATADAVLADESIAVPTQVSREGNVVSLTVPYSEMGYPPLGAPIHNIRVVVRDAESGTIVAAAPAGDGAQADLQPMYGRAFTVLNPVPAPPAPAETACTVPGITLFVDGKLDDAPLLPTADNGSADLLSLHVAEPADRPDKLVFTMKLRSLERLPPNVNWYVIFFGPAKGKNVTGKWHVEMETNEVSAVSFGYGRYDPANQNFSRGPDTADGDEPINVAMEGSTYDAGTGTITLVINKRNFGVSGDTLANIGVSVYQLVGANGSGLLQTIDEGGGSVAYALRAPSACPGGAGPRDTGSGLLLGGAPGVPLLVAFGAAAALRRRLRVVP